MVEVPVVEVPVVEVPVVEVPVVEVPVVEVLREGRAARGVGLWVPAVGRRGV